MALPNERRLCGWKQLDVSVTYAVLEAARPSVDNLEPRQVAT